jgi:hypothetical protein
MQQFSDATGLPAHTLRRLHAKGQLVPKFVTEGGHRRYTAEQIEEAKKFVKKKRLMGGKSVVSEDELEIDAFFAYLLGLAMACGKVKDGLKMQIEMKDEQILRDVAKRLDVSLSAEESSLFALTLPAYDATRLIEYGVSRNKAMGFEVPELAPESFRHFLRGLFDGNGSVIERDGRMVWRLYGHAKPLAQVQATLLERTGVYAKWYKDKRRKATGMLEVNRKADILIIFQYMYKGENLCLKRKHRVFVENLG